MSPAELFSTWTCDVCDVQGVDPESAPHCWFCGGPVTVTARWSAHPGVCRLYVHSIDAAMFSAAGGT